MAAVVLALALLSEGVDGASVAANGLRLSITPDKTKCVVGEPIRFAVRLENVGSEAVTGTFVLDPTTALLVVEYRRKGGEFRAFTFQARPGVDRDVDIWRRPKSLRAGEARTADFVLGYDVQREAFLCGEVGVVEVRAKHRPFGELRVSPPEPDTQLVSETTKIDIGANADKGAVSKDAAVVAQYESGRIGAPLSDEAIDAAIDFLRVRPTVAYGELVREGLRMALAERVMDGRATERQRRTYDELRGAGRGRADRPQ